MNIINTQKCIALTVAPMYLFHIKKSKKYQTAEQRILIEYGQCISVLAFPSTGTNPQNIDHC